MVIILTDVVFSTRRVGAYRIATQLRSIGIDVEVIDYLSAWNIDDLIKILDQYPNIEWVGYSTAFGLPVDKTIIEGGEIPRLTYLDSEEDHKIQNYFNQRNIPMVLGGPNADYIKKQVTGFYIIIGFGDDAIKHVHEHITNNGPLKYIEVNNNKVIYADTDYTNYSLTGIETKFVYSDFVSSNERIPIEISRGCIFKCAFCYFGHIGKKPGTYIRCKDGIKDDIKRAYDNYGIKNFLFLDDTFNDSIDKMRLIKEIRQELDIPFEFWAYGRLDLIAAHEEMFDLIPDIGWTAITFGIETLTKKTGSAVGKGANPDKLKNTLLKLKERYPNIYIQGNLIVGLPRETKEDIVSTIDWFAANPCVDHLSVRPLSINNPKNILYTSQIARNPDKFGYKITTEDHLIENVNFNKWENVNWTRAEARTFATEMNTYLEQKHMASVHKNFSNKIGKDNAIYYVKQKTEYLQKLSKHY